ncbi:hypothetical protein, partial [Parvibaculum sp.]|uniref:hypothetical protein n=1 Tax=Parvibaculum sp. TaxID=2024848 RepID=UPI003C7127AE
PTVQWSFCDPAPEDWPHMVNSLLNWLTLARKLTSKGGISRFSHPYAMESGKREIDETRL